MSAREGNSHPIVSVGFRFEMDEDEKVSNAHLYFGGVGKGLLECSNGAAALKDKPLISQTLKAALDVRLISLTALRVLCVLRGSLGQRLWTM